MIIKTELTREAFLALTRDLPITTRGEHEGYTITIRATEHTETYAWTADGAYYLDTWIDDDAPPAGPQGWHE